MTAIFDETMWRALDEDAHKLHYLRRDEWCPECRGEGGWDEWEPDGPDGALGGNVSVKCPECGGTGYQFTEAVEE